MKVLSVKLKSCGKSGIYRVPFFGGEVIDQELFYASLSDTDDRIMCADIDAAMAEKIKSEYGIYGYYIDPAQH